MKIFLVIGGRNEGVPFTQEMRGNDMRVQGEKLGENEKGGRRRGENKEAGNSNMKYLAHFAFQLLLFWNIFQLVTR